MCHNIFPSYTISPLHKLLVHDLLLESFFTQEVVVRAIFFIAACFPGGGGNGRKTAADILLQQVMGNRCFFPAPEGAVMIMILLCGSKAHNEV